MTAVRMSECCGLWRRTLLIDVDGSEDVSTDVRWLQGITAFVDLRRPVPAAPDAQDGFAGWLHQSGDVFTWERFAGLQPQGEFPDEGRMHWEGQVLVETGVHSAYVEHWVREPLAGPCWALTLAGPNDAQGLLIRVGALFGWASSSPAGVEISLGTVTDNRWEITDSSEPARTGAELLPRVRGNELTESSMQTWTVVDSEGDVNL
ncbi:hypothetical protein [Mycobacterium sp. MS1601]|uniref:hypothetical protein n=1 Tax=Mycobacterium sp. MS1601 TaxID=1936029 RepID=UPI001F3DA5A5|nr:hypothetical protein [Mycobacterium sp. MS1601]